MDERIVILSDRAPLATGRVRQVYARPGRADQVLKVIRPEAREAFERRSALSKRLRAPRLGPYSSFQLEWRESARIAYRAEVAGLASPIAEIGGIVRTDLGLALACERVEADGRLVTLADMFGREQGPADAARLNAFAHAIYALGVNAHDLAARNVMLDGRTDRLLLVDGFGDKTLLPFRRWLPFLAADRADRRFRRMQRGGLRWDPATRRFSLGARS